MSQIFNIRAELRTNLFLLIFMLIPLCSSFTQSEKTNSSQVNKIEKIISYEIENSFLRIKCSTQNSTAPVYVQISFLFEDVPQIQIAKNKDELNEPDGLHCKVTDGNDSIVIFTEKTRLSFSKSNFTISIYRGNELLLTEEIGIKNYRDYEHIQITNNCSNDEHFYGFGEKFNGLDQKGNKVIMELNDAYMSDDDSTYKSIPFFLSSKKYGLLVNSYQRVIFNMGNLIETEYNFINPDSYIEYLVFTNQNPLEVISQYTAITGRSPIIPKWSLEPWLSRRRMTGWHSPKAAEADIDMIIKSDYRLGVVMWEGFRMMFNERFGNQANLLSDKWHELGLKQVCWDYTGHIQKNSPYVASALKNYFVRNSDSSYSLGHRSGQNLYIDPTSKDAMSWWKKTLYERRFLGVNGHSAQEAWNLDGIKLDFSELFPKGDTDLLDIDKSYGMHNHHAVEFSEQIYNWLQNIKPEGGITWVRGGGLGIQKVGFAWGGDRGRTFEQLRGTVAASLGASVSGISLIGHDLGGYRGGNSIEERKVYIRGVQYSTFTPSFHDHGSAPAQWEQNKFGRDNYSFYSRVRYNILPYLYHYVKVSHEQGIPIMRTLFMHHPADKNTFTIEDEYYFGENILVAPILTSSNEREIYLPDGEWIDFWTLNQYSGKQYIDYITPLDRIPLFVKEGTILPLELNTDLKIGGDFSHKDKNNLLLTFQFFSGKESQLEFKREGLVSVKKTNEGENISILVGNIHENYALIVNGFEAVEVLINGTVQKNISQSEFSISNQGWRFDKKRNQLLIKILSKNDIKDYKIELRNYSKHQSIKNENEIKELNPPKILKTTGWDQAVDIYFSEEKEAEFYLVEYWEVNNDKKIDSLYTAEPFITIGELENDKEYGFVVSSVNGKQESVNSPIYKVRPNKQTPFYKTNSEDLFISANHYLRAIVNDDSSRKFTYGLLSPEKKEYTVWAKLKIGYSHYQYFRWYKIGQVTLDEGENYVTLNLIQKEWIPQKLYFTVGTKERPLLKSEIEGDFEERSVKIKNEKNIEFPKR